MKKIMIISTVLLFNVISSAKASAETIYFKFGTGTSRAIFSINDKDVGEKRRVEKNSSLNMILGVGLEHNNLDYSVDLSFAKYNFSVSNIKNLVTSFNVNYLFKNSSKITPYLGSGLNINSFITTDENDKRKVRTRPTLSLKTGVRVELKENIKLDFNIQQTTNALYYSDEDITTKYRNFSTNLSLLFSF